MKGILSVVMQVELWDGMIIGETNEGVIFYFANLTSEQFRFGEWTEMSKIFEEGSFHFQIEFENAEDLAVIIYWQIK